MFNLSATWLVYVLFIGIFAFACKTLYPFWVERKNGRNLFKYIDTPKPHWLFGNLLEVNPNEESIMKIGKDCIKHPKVGALWFGPAVSYLMVFHPHVLKPVLSQPEPKDNIAYRFIRPWIGDGLLVSSGKKWHRNRHLLTRAFHFDVLKQYVKVFDDCAKIMLTKWDTNRDGMPVEVYGDVSLMTLDSMLRCAISYETDCQTSRSENRYITSVYSLTTIAMKRIFNPFYHSDFIFSLTPSGRKFKEACDYIHQFDEQVINERKASLQTLLKKNENEDPSSFRTDDIQRITDIRHDRGEWLDFMDILLLTRDEDDNGLSDREIRDEVDTFLFEGHDTTASGISWAFYCLAIYPQYQEKCRNEVVRVIGNKAEIEWSDLSKLPYLTMFIKEVLRLYPPVFAIARRIQNPITFPRGFGEDQRCHNDTPDNPETCKLTVQPPLNIGMPLLVLHRNETVWDDPAVFDPSRFESQHCMSRSPFAYLPFSAGPRNCIGQNFAMNEMKVALVNALQRFRFFVDKDCPRPEMMPMIVLKATDGIHIKLEKL